MTIPDWNSEDYLVHFDDIHYNGPITRAPFILKAGRVLAYLHNVIFPDAIKAITNGGELSGLLMGFSIVEYLAGYYGGKQSRGKDFIEFLEQYFPNQYKPFLSDIYAQLRNGLVHNLTLLNPWITSDTIFLIEKRSDQHLQINDGKVVFSIYHFIEDTRRAMVIYFHGLIMKPDENKELRNRFEQRFNRKSGMTSTMVKTE